MDRSCAIWVTRRNRQSSQGRSLWVGEGLGMPQGRPNGRRSSWKATSKGPGVNSVGQARPVGRGRLGQSLVTYRNWLNKLTLGDSMGPRELSVTGREGSPCQ